VDVLLDPAEELGRAPGLKFALFRCHGARSSLEGRQLGSDDLTQRFPTTPRNSGASEALSIKANAKG
jgi:hypothetical protein